MKEKHKILLFTLVIVVLLISITSTSATSLNQTTTNTTITTQPSQTTTIETTHKPVKNITKKNIKNPNNKNETIKTIKNTTKKHNIKSDQETITINPRNKDRFNDYEFEDNTHIIIEGTVKDLHITIDTKNITITGKNNRSQLYNSMIEETEDGNVHISNLTFNTTTESQYDVTMNLFGHNNTIDHVNFYTEHDKYPQEHYREINIESNNNSIHDCYFDIIYPGVNIDWSTVYGGVRKANVIIAYGDHNEIYNNTIKLKEGVLLDKDYGTIEAIDIFGSNNLVTENNIDVRGTKYLYGIMVYYDNNTITNNVINVISVRYANGISIDGIASNCTVENNTIHVECQNNTIINSKDDDSAYGIIIIESDYKGFQYNIENSRVANNILKGNTITGNASQMYGIENFGGTGTRVESNHIDISGGRVQGIAYAGAENVIIGNDIKVDAQYSDLLENSPDYFRPWTGGIYSYSGHKNFVFNNTVLTKNGPAVRIDREYNTTVTGNLLSSTNSSTVHITRNSAGNVVYGNTLLSNSDEDSISTIPGNMVYNNFGRRITPETDPTNPNNPFIQNQTNTNQTQNPLANNTNTNQTQNPTTNNTNTNQTQNPVTNNTNTNQTQNPTTNNTNTNQTQNPITNNTNTNQTQNPTTNNTNTNQTQNPTTNNTNTNQTQNPTTNNTNTNQTQNPTTNNTNTNQTINTNTTQPTEPTNTTQPTQPTNTTQPTEPTNTTQPTQPTNTTQPTEPTNTTQPTQPTNTTQPTEPTNTNQSTNHTTTQQNQNNTQITNQTIQNTTIPQKQQTNTNSSQIVNNTRQTINSNEITKTNSSTENQKQTSSTGQSPEHGEDSSSSDSESSDSSDSSDSSTSDASSSESSQQSESSVSSAVGSSGAAQATAVVSEITPKESKIENPFNPYVIVGILLILTVAFAYGFTKQSKN